MSHLASHVVPRLSRHATRCFSAIDIVAHDDTEMRDIKQLSSVVCSSSFSSSFSAWCFCQHGKVLLPSSVLLFLPAVLFEHTLYETFN